MFNLRNLRLIARAFYGSMILTGLMIAFYGMTAKADPPNRPAQTQTGMARGNTGGIPEHQEFPALPGGENPWTDMSAEVQARVVENDNTPYIHLRAEEAQNLRENLEISESRTVFLRADTNGVGRGGLMEEFTRLYPDFQVRRLNALYFVNKDEYNSKIVFKKLLLDLEREAANKKILLFIENPGALANGAGFKTIDALWEHMAFDNVKLYKGVQANQKFWNDNLKEKMALTERAISMDVLPPAFEGVLDMLNRVRGEVEKRGIVFKQSAIEEIARLAVRHRRHSAMYWAKEMLMRSENYIFAQKQSGTLNRDALTLQLKSSQRRYDALKADLVGETNANEIARTNKELASLQTIITNAKAEIERLGQVTENKPARLAAMEVEILDLERKRDAERSKRGLNPFARTELEKQYETLLETRSREKTELADDILLEKAHQGKPSAKVSVDDVRRIASKWLNIPVERLSGNFDEGIRNLKNMQIYGQPHVIKQLEGVLVVSSNYMNDGAEVKKEDIAAIRSGAKVIQDAPIGVFMFAGPTGVGKTETARELERTLGMKLLRFDMVEFQAEHTVSRFMGSPPGYVGQDSIGELLQKVKDNPESIILFDEIEKAHPKVLTALMTMIDSGFMTSGNGEVKVDFRKTIVIFTTNLVPNLASMTRAQLIESITKYEPTNIFALDPGSDMQKLRREAWRLEAIASEKILPEVAGRISNIIAFNKLDQETGARIAKKLMRQLRSVLRIHDIDLVVTAETVAKMMSYFNEAEGGRSLKRAFNDFFRTPLAYAVNEGKIKAGTIALGLSPDKNSLEFRTGTPEQIQTGLGEGTDLNAMKDKLVANRKAPPNLELRKTLAATSDAVRKIFAPEKDGEPRLIIGERMFRTLKLIGR